MSDETLSGPIEDEELAALDDDAVAEDDAADPAHEAKKDKRLTEAEKAEIRELFELGKMRMGELATKYGVTRQALFKWFKKDGIVYGSRAHEIAAAISSGLKKAEATHAERYAEKRMEWIEESRVQGYKDLKQAIMIVKKTLADAVVSKAPLGSIDDDLKALTRYHRMLENNAAARLKLLDADNVVDEKDLPKLQIEDLTVDKIVEFHKNNGITDEEELDAIINRFANPLGEAPEE
jgi:transposase-like protein